MESIASLAVETTYQHYHSPMKIYDWSDSSSPIRISPQKKSIRYIEKDQNTRREKYNGTQWKLICTWKYDQCHNYALYDNLCQKHSRAKRDKTLMSDRSKSVTFSRSAVETYQQTDAGVRLNDESNRNKITTNDTGSIVGSEFSHFQLFSIDSDDDSRSESRSTACSHRNDCEYIRSTTHTSGMSAKELISKNFPPLTDFEELYIGTLLMEKLSTNCSMLAAQFYVCETAIEIVKKNYQVQMSTVAPQYFYDFLLRHPLIAVRYKHWFLQCKPFPSLSGSSIDTKIWVLSMMVRGALASNDVIKE